MVDKPLTVTYDQLTAGFTAHSVVATLACAGNRRAELLRVRPIPGKDPWEHGAISTAEWRGVRLVDVLAAAGGHRADGPPFEILAPGDAQEARPGQCYSRSLRFGQATSAEAPS